MPTETDISAMPLASLLPQAQQLAQQAIQALPDAAGMANATALTACHASAASTLSTLADCWQRIAPETPETARPTRYLSQEFITAAAHSLAAASAYLKPSAWSSADCRRNALRVWQLVLQHGGGTSASAWVAELLPAVAEALGVREWKDRPAAAHALVEVATRVVHPDMGARVPLLLPLMLQWIEHYEVDIRLLGLKLARHVLREANTVDLTARGVAAVLYESVFRLLFVDEAEVAASALPCIAQLLAVICHNPLRRGSQHHDDVMRQVLKTMRWENKIFKRRAMADGLAGLIDVNGLNICLHLTELMPILRAYCGDPDPETRIASLRALRKLLVHAEPRLILPDRRQWLQELLDEADKIPNGVSTEAKTGIAAAVAECRAVVNGWGSAGTNSQPSQS